MATSRKRRKRKGKGKDRSQKGPNVAQAPAAEELKQPEPAVDAARPSEQAKPGALDLEQAAAHLGLEEEAAIALISAGRLPMVRRSGRLEVETKRITDKAGLRAADGSESARMPPAPPREIPARLWPLRDAILALREPLPEPDEPPPEPEPPPLRIRIGVGLPAVPPADRRELSFARTYSSMKSEFGDEPVLIGRLIRREVRGFRFGPDLLVPRKDLQGLPLTDAPVLRGVEEPPAIPGVTADWIGPLELPREEVEDTPPVPTRAETQLGIDIVDEAVAVSSLTEESEQAEAEAPAEAATAGGAGQSQLEKIKNFLDRSGDGDVASRRKVLLGGAVTAQVAKTGAVLVGVHGEQRKAWRLGSGLVIIGRGRTMSGGEQRIILDDLDLAMDHALIIWNGNGFDVIDQGHTSGTMLDRRRLPAKQPQTVETGGLIQVGGLSALLLFSRMGIEGKRLDASEMPAKSLLDYLVFRKLFTQARAREVEKEMARAEVCVEEVLVVAGDVEPLKLKDLIAEAASVASRPGAGSESDWMALVIRILVVLMALAVLGTVVRVLLFD